MDVHWWASRSPATEQQDYNNGLFIYYPLQSDERAKEASGFESGHMTVHAPLTMTKEAFFAWVDQREERFEYAGGRVVMMVRVSWNHAVVTANLVTALNSRLNRQLYNAVPESFAVDVGPSVRFPDVVVESMRPEGKALKAKAPILIAEVLSPSTLHLTFGDKRAEYLGLPSLEIYMIVSPDEPRVWLWQRADGEFPTTPEIVEGVDKQIVLRSLGIEFPLPELYQGVSP